MGRFSRMRKKFATFVGADSKISAKFGTEITLNSLGAKFRPGLSMRKLKPRSKKSH
jgi:hypothetical protein